MQQQALEDLSAKQEKVNKLAKHLASIMGTQDIDSWALLKWFHFWTCFAAAFICTGRQPWQPVYVICCFVLYLHWWWTLMPSGCNMCNSRDSLVLVASLFISLLSLFICLLVVTAVLFLRFLVATVTYLWKLGQNNHGKTRTIVTMGLLQAVWSMGLLPAVGSIGLLYGPYDSWAFYGP